jgi:hypothetical protein
MVVRIVVQLSKLLAHVGQVHALVVILYHIKLMSLAPLSDMWFDSNLVLKI